MAYFFKKFYPTILLIAVISFLSLASFKSMPSVPTFPHMDKLVHFCMYMALSFILLFDLSRTHPLRKVNAKGMVTAFVFATAMGGIMEIMQGCLTETRAADWWDMLANTCGATAGILVGWAVLPFILKLIKRR